MQNNLNLYSPEYINYNNSVKQNPFDYQFKNNNFNYNPGDTSLVYSNSLYPLKELMLKMENKNKLLNSKNSNLNFNNIKEGLYGEQSFDLKVDEEITNYLDEDIKEFAKANNIGINKNSDNTFTFKLNDDTSK